MAKKLEIGARDVAVPAVLFAGVMLGFAGLGALAGWPNRASGWPQVTVIAALFAALPLIVRLLNFLQDSRASVEGLGVKLNFAAAVRAGATESATLGIGEIKQGLNLPETGSRELEKATAQLAANPVVVIDLEHGKAWYKTRLFAVAAAATLLGAPRLLVVLGQRGGKSRQLGGLIAPADLLRAVLASDSRYDFPWKQAQRYVPALRETPVLAKADPPAPAKPDPTLPRLQQYRHPWSQDGDRIIMRLVIDQLKQPDNLQPAPAPPPVSLEPPADLPWLTLAEFERITDAWLNRDAVDLSAPIADRLKALFQATGDHALAARGQTFEGVIDLRQAEREILRQLAERASE